MNSWNLYERRSFADPHRLGRPAPAPDDGSIEAALAQWIEAEGSARVLVDDTLRICWMSRSAQSLMSGPNSLLIRNGHIRTRENRFDRQLQELIAGASQRVSTCCVHDAKAGEHLVLIAVRLSAPSDNMIGLTLERADGDFPFHLADLPSAFGLTRTESRVAHNLVGGRTAEQTAEDLGVSLETIRTHIKRAYAKLGVSSREGFFHRLMPFVVRLPEYQDPEPAQDLARAGLTRR